MIIRVPFSGGLRVCVGRGNDPAFEAYVRERASRPGPIFERVTRAQFRADRGAQAQAL